MRGIESHIRKSMAPRESRLVAIQDVSSNQTTDQIGKICRGPDKSILFVFGWILRGEITEGGLNQLLVAFLGARHHGFGELRDCGVSRSGMRASWKCELCPTVLWRDEQPVQSDCSRKAGRDGGVRGKIKRLRTDISRDDFRDVVPQSGAPGREVALTELNRNSVGLPRYRR